MKIVTKIVVIFSLVLLQSCESNSPTQVDKNELEDINSPYPSTGNQPVDFLSNQKDYKIQYEAKGDLNKDGLVDVAIVLAHKTDRTALRPMLILLQNKDKSYRLDKVSELAIPSEYMDDYKVYYTEEIKIEDGLLKIELFGNGPSSNLFSHYKYSGNDFLLVYIEVYHAGAGSWFSAYYDLEKGKLTEETTNTMEEDMPTVTETHQLKKETHFFESASPADIIQEALEIFYY